MLFFLQTLELLCWDRFFSWQVLFRSSHYLGTVSVLLSESCTSCLPASFYVRYFSQPLFVRWLWVKVTTKIFVSLSLTPGRELWRMTQERFVKWNLVSGAGGLRKMIVLRVKLVLNLVALLFLLGVLDVLFPHLMRNTAVTIKSWVASDMFSYPQQSFLVSSLALSW